MSITSCYVILFILLARLLLKKVPKIFSLSLWSVALFRLICPVSFESIFSLLPNQPGFSVQNTVSSTVPPVGGGAAAVSDALRQSLVVQTGTVVEKTFSPAIILAVVWFAGVVVLLTYSLISMCKLKESLEFARQIEDNVYEVRQLKTPFVFGLVHPRIYIPAKLSETQRIHVILHEQTHIRRRDHLVKFASFLALSMHWFNPMVWMAFVLMSSDMEMSCDEYVLSRLGRDEKKGYSSSLLSLADDRCFISGSPLAFGESNVKGRIKNILHYKKATFWVSCAAVVLVVTVLFGLLGNPQTGITEAQAIEIIQREFSMPMKPEPDGLKSDVAGQDCYIFSIYVSMAQGDSSEPEDRFIYNAAVSAKDGTVYLYDVAENVWNELSESNKPSILTGADAEESQCDPISSEEVSEPDDTAASLKEGQPAFRESTSSDQPMFFTQSSVVSGISFLLPADGEYTNPVQKGHYGVDIQGEIGNEIRAAASGTVITSEQGGSYGKHVLIDHGDGYVTLYAHCSELLVKVGTAVEEGDLIAKIGQTGNAAEPHVHFEIRKDGEYLDCTQLFKE